MTYCAGWKYGNGTFLIADSALTSSAIKPTSKLSSFGEVHRKVQHEYVEEGLLKLAPIGKHAAVAYAGDVGIAVEIVEFLMANWEFFGNDIEETADRIDKTFGPIKNLPDTALIFAWWAEGGSRLARWNSREGLDSSSDDFYSIGSLRSYHQGLTEDVIQEIRRLKPLQEDVLPTVTALVQSYGIHDDMIAQNVGGAVCGLFVGPHGIKWQQDTGYLLYNRQNSSSEFIDTRVRDNALVVHSSLTNETRVMMSSATKSWEAWLQNWQQILNSELGTDHLSAVVFIRTEDKLVTVLGRTPGREGLIRFRRVGNQLSMDLAEQLRESLQQDLGEPTSDKSQFKLIFLRDA